MFKFDIKQLKVVYVTMESITTALGGAMRYIDGDSGKSTRVQIPFAVARAFIKRYKTGKFFIPVQVAVVWYQDQVVYVEKRTQFTSDHETIHWQSNSQRNIENILVHTLADGQWYTDGYSIYQLPDNAYDDDHEYLSADGKFKAVSVQAIKFSQLEIAAFVENPGTMSLVQFTTGDKKVLSPPIWQNVLDIRNTIKGNSETRSFRFDVIEQRLSVNLDFVIYAAQRIGHTFGFKAVIPLKLQQLMVNMNTVNLPNVPKSIRETKSIDFPFKQAFAWVLSFAVQSTTLQQYAEVRATMKQLCQKGTTSDAGSQALNDHITPALVDPQQALQTAKDTMSEGQLFNYLINNGRVIDNNDQDVERRVLLGNIN